MNRSTHPHFVPNDLMGTRHETAVLLVGTAKEFGIDQRDIASTHGGYWITTALADLVYADDADGDETEDGEPATETEDDKSEDPKKTSGNRAEKTNSQKE